MDKKQALEAMERIFNYCEEIDLHLSEDERTGYNMLPDVQLVERYILSKVIIESAFSDDTSKAERIRELLKADKDDRLVVLPCKVGDRLYEVTGRKTISVYKVKAIRVELFGLFIEWDIVEGFVWQSLSGINAGEIGKTVFLSREEAEKALEAMKK